MKNISWKNRYLSFLFSLTIIFSLCAFAPIGKAAVDNSPAVGTGEFEWKSIIFGQSTADGRNSIVVDKAKDTVIVTAGSQDGSATGGKVTGSHDGIAYYYLEIDPSKNFELSAKITVNFFAKPRPDNQEAFGIMARDAIGINLDPTVFASNMVMVGGYRGAVQSVFRNKVKDVSGAGAVMENVYRLGDRPANDGSATYHLKLRKTNTGYHVLVDNKPEKIYYRPKQLEVLNPNRIYVGFFAARVASITVSEIEFKISDVSTDPQGAPEPPEPVAPSISLVSLSATSLSSYNLNVLTNVKGSMEIKQEGTVIFNGPIEKAGSFIKNVTLVTGKNTFDISFTPDPTENITTAATIRITRVVTFQTYGKPGGKIYVSPNGQPTSVGTKKDPIDIYSAVQFLQPGQTIYVRGGVYNLKAPIIIERGNDGISGKLKVLSAYQSERPVFDFGKSSVGFLLLGNYWKVACIDITRASSHGFRVSGNYNLVELVNTYANGDTGLQISTAFPDDKPVQWPSNNLILNCTSYDNRDASENNADGFAAKLTCGPGNVFRGCISHNNCDDGFDLYSKLETGPIGAVTIENSIACGNGRLSDGTKTKGDGNGFKVGGEGLPVKHLLRNCLSFNNETTGVTSNSNPAMIVENTTSVDNGTANFSFTWFSGAPQFIAKNNISFRTKTGAVDNFPESLKTSDNYFFNGTESVNSGGIKVTQEDFKNVTPVAFERNSNGTIKVADYMTLTSKSLIKGGARLGDFSNITDNKKK